MKPDELKAGTLEGFDRMFNNGDLAYVDDAVAPGAVDHQEPKGTVVTAHLKEVISTLRIGFPDLRFEVHEILCEGDIVASRSTMTGTHRGPLNIGPMAGLPFTGAHVEVPHMHFFRYDERGRLTDLWHVWNTLLLARQLGAPAPDLRIGATT
jgi:predicted ester cyclase